jgi:hypothetical protein
VPYEVKNLWPSQLTRSYTAFGRLMTLLTLNDSEDPELLAELGLINEGDKRKQFFHFQDPYTQIEEVHAPNLLATLQKQLPSSMLLKGRATYNVNLAQTLNAMPPSKHLSGGKKQAEGKIDQLISVGNLLMSVNNQDASVNLFSQKMGLTRLFQHSFKAQTWQEKSSLRHNDFKKVLDNSLVCMRSKKSSAEDPGLFDESALKPSEEADQNEFCMLGGLFEQE